MISTARQTIGLSAFISFPSQYNQRVIIAAVASINQHISKHHLHNYQPKYARSPSFLNLFKKLRLSKSPDSIESPRLTPQMVTDILRINETHSIESDNGSGVIREVQCNHLQANKPIEDRRLEARVTGTDQFLFSVIDGHGGHHCAQSVKDRLFQYIAVAMANPFRLDDLYKGEAQNSAGLVETLSTSRCSEASSDLACLQRDSLQNFANDCLDTHSHDTSVSDSLLEAFLRLDHDMSVEPSRHPGPSSLNTQLTNIAFSGAVACVAYLDGLDLYVASAGDCQCVVGSHHIDDDSWVATPLSTRHDADNTAEVQRLFSKHPNESNNILKGGRLFGGLMPLRAFGDNRYKWTRSQQGELQELAHRSGDPALQSYQNLHIPNSYRTPPYLDAEPEVVHYRLSPKDRFLVLASDGLWDSDDIDEDKVVSLVGHHIDGKQVLHSYRPPDGASLEAIHEALSKRKANLAKRTVDGNAATHLLRHALGLEHGYVSAQLTLPQHLVRQYRDDITITVVYFDTEYIKDWTRQRDDK